ncbi:MAG: hypothetical protein PVG90_13625 [Bacillota bacterium]
MRGCFEDFIGCALADCNNRDNCQNIYLLYLDYDGNGRAVDYKLYLDFTEMAAAEVDYFS